MRPLNRRDFFLDTGRFSAAIAAAGLVNSDLTAHSPSPQPTRADPIDRLRVAVIGTGGRGKDHVSGFLNKQLNSEITTVCDCDERAPRQVMRSIEQIQGRLPKFETDLRRVLDDKDIDAVSIATPNHWHALAAIWAIQAGKHVYVEKPVSHNVSEGRRVVEAARKHNKICQTGTQIRTMSGIREAMQFLHDGKLGKVNTAIGLCWKPRDSIGKFKGDGVIPWSLDYNLWCGPAPKRDPRRTKFHYDWHWLWDYGNGDLGNQGIHQMDVARWGLNKRELPRSVVSLGGRYAYEDDGETANTQLCVFDYGDCEVIFDVRGRPTKDYVADRRGKDPAERKRSAKVGNIFIAEKGYLVCADGYRDAIALDHNDNVIRAFASKREDDHYANFAQAVRAGRREILNADIEEGHLSSAMCHLGNISYRLGQELPFDSQETKVINSGVSSGEDKPATEALTFMRKHLETNGIDLSKVKCRVGPRLAIDPKTEQFVDNSEANKMLTREYRKGFEVPSKV